MRSRQAGITFIGWVVLLIPVALVGYAAIRLTPVYLNYLKVSKAVKQTADEYGGETQINATSVRKTLQSHFDIDSIDYPTVNDIAVGRDGTRWVLSADYTDEVPFFGGISLLVHFEKRAVVE